MEINIRLPDSLSANTYKGLTGYLKQFELAIHHAQKAVENAEATGVEITEDTYVCFEHPLLKNLDGEMKDFDSNYYDELQYVELKINLQ